MVEKMLLNKVCTCGNRMQIIGRKEGDTIEFECVENPNLTCYMLTDRHIGCFACHKVWPFNRKAHKIDMRRDNWPA